MFERLLKVIFLVYVSELPTVRSGVELLFPLKSQRVLSRGFTSLYEVRDSFRSTALLAKTQGVEGIMSLLAKKGHFMNSVLASPQIYSCAVDSFLEVSSHVLLPYLSNVPLRNEFTELLFKACSQYVSSNGSSRLLGQIREPVWRYLGHNCSTFTVRDCNACFRHLFEEKTFGKLNADERNIFFSSRTFQSFCQTWCRDVTLNSTILLNFVYQYALQSENRQWWQLKSCKMHKLQPCYAYQELLYGH